MKEMIEAWEKYKAWKYRNNEQVPDFATFKDFMDWCSTYREEL